MKTIGIAILQLCFCLSAFPDTAAVTKRFSVLDLIQTSYFVDATEETNIVGRGAYPLGRPIISPDKQHIFFITQRGLVATNTIEATLWLVDQQSVSQYIAHSGLRPTARKIAMVSSQSNTQVLSNARWLPDSKRIAFLGKDHCACQQIFIADITSGVLSRVTDSSSYVTAYDISGQTIAYTTADPRVDEPTETAIDVAGSNLYSLLFRKSVEKEDVDETVLRNLPNRLHVNKNGVERSSLHFMFKGKPLRLFMPTLAVSPDERSLVTVAPVAEIPQSWKAFKPGANMPFLPLTADNKYALADENPFKASQYVIANLETGEVSPILDAPAGRGLAYYNAPTKAVWFSDNRRLILSNTFLPVEGALDEAEKSKRAGSPDIVVFDRSTNQVERLIFGDHSSLNNGCAIVREISVDDKQEAIQIGHAKGIGDGTAICRHEKYSRIDSSWVNNGQSAVNAVDNSIADTEVEITQDLNQPPVLIGKSHKLGGDVVIFDPNPDFNNLAKGETTIYHWRDKNGHERTGILALPPDYSPKIRYPLVIQTHHQNTTSFFADGPYTTGYGGRALVAKDIVVFQVAESTSHLGTAEEGEDQAELFEELIDSLTALGIIDPQRVGIIGFSRTCFHVLYTLTHRPNLFAAASIADGLNFGYLQYVLFVDLFNYQELSEVINGGLPFGEGLKKWALNAPGFNLDKEATPLLIGAFEKGELIAEWETYAGLRRLRKPVDLWWWRKENTPHILVQPEQRYFSQQLAIDWFAFWLKGEEDPSPRKELRYARWRELRELQLKDRRATAAPDTK
jgi:dipeptidyl aminopeptidase/acylaminoacyl peptidase